MLDPSLSDRLFDYVGAVTGSWWGILSVGLGLLRLAPVFIPRLSPIAEAVQKQRHTLAGVAFAVFVVANFQIYDAAKREARRSAAAPQTFDWRSLPTSPEKLKPGDVWNNGGIPSIVE